ncbi:MAG: polysaccharide biosynthesis/export family protein [bacterium]
MFPIKKFPVFFIFAALHLLLFSPVLSAQEAGSEDRRDQPYYLGPEDILEVSVWKEPNLTRQVVVTPDGKISFPFVGEISAKGATVKELEEKIKKAISSYIPEAVVTVMLVQAKSMNVYVLGAVARPGVYTLGRSINVLQALALAGGLTPFAREDRITIIRDNEGRTAKLAFDYRKIRKGKSLEQNILLKSGDVILVP